MGQFEIIEFYLELVRRAQERGICCAVTNGMACVAYAVAEATKDCDLLCEPEMATDFLQLLAESPLAGAACQYRGNISPPLDARWHKGGWTSHFEWPGTEAFLDVFGIAPRARSRWQDEMMPPYAHPHVVADMKRTARDKDWPFISALGAKLVESGDERGWLHLYDKDRMQDLLSKQPDISEAVMKARPSLRLFLEKDRLFPVVLRLERVFWETMSKRRVRLYESSLKSYLVAVRKASAGNTLPLHEDHLLRVKCAEDHLPLRPMSVEVLERMTLESREDVMLGFDPGLARWLPDLNPNFNLLISELHESS
jgi:hypothetical protein